jgi:hypothetical protein
MPTSHVTISGGNIVVNSSGGLAGGQLMAVTSTNISTPLDNWTTVTNDVFDGSGNYSLTIPYNPGIAEQFYMIRVF